MNIHAHSSKVIVACAFGLLIAFFLPWFQIFGVGVSGYNLGQLGSEGNYAWIVPIAAAVTILLSLTGVNNRIAGAITGLIPLVAILYVLVRLGTGVGVEAIQGFLQVTWQVLAIGGWLTILLSIIMLFTAFTPAVAN